MTAALPLDLILGPPQAARVLRQMATDIAHQDHLDPGTALRLVRERATDNDPLLLAAPGQIWAVRDDADPDADVPARRLAVHARLEAPPRVVVTDLDNDQEKAEIHIEGLYPYQLESWRPADTLLERDA